MNSIRSWWEHLGQPRYPNATRLQITADCGGSNGNRTKRWKVELQKLANDTELEIAVCHFAALAAGDRTCPRIREITDRSRLKIPLIIAPRPNRPWPHGKLNAGGEERR